MEELSAIAKRGEPVYGKSDLPEFVQGTAFRNSVWSQLKFQTLPWVSDDTVSIVSVKLGKLRLASFQFNLVSHPHHGVDTVS
jgi:hypothetical protein